MIKTIILCGGRGTRLKPLTESIPKPLILLNGKPLIQYILESHIKKGFRKFILCIGWKGEAIIDFIKQQNFDAEFEFSDAGPEAGILRRLHYARGLIGERAFVSYGDTIIDMDLAEMLSDHIKKKAGLTITISEISIPFGLVASSQDGRLLAFNEKPVQTFFIGHMLIERTALDRVGPDLLNLPDGDGLIKFIRQMAHEKLVGTYLYRGPQITFNTRQDLEEGRLRAFFTQEEDV